MNTNFPGETEKAAQEARQKQVAVAKQRDIKDVAKMLKMPEFRRFCWRKLSEAGIYHDSFNMNTKIEDYNLGRKRAGLDLLVEINAADPNSFAQIQREAVSEALSKPKEETPDGD